MGLETYQKMRDFRRTPEPRGRVAKTQRRRFIVQEHHASMLHFDFRLEMGGVLKSWSVRKGPSLDPSVKRLAVETEDHPVEYLKFEGHIPEGEYGAGEHMIWDEGTYRLLSKEDPLEQLAAGRMKFELKGRKLRGEWSLVRFAGRERQWLLIKSDGEYAAPGWELELRQPAGDAKTVRNEKKKTASARRAVKRTRGAKKQAGKAVPAGRAFAAKELAGDVDVKVGPHVVPLTSLDRVYWPDEGLTKGDLVRYYYEVSDFILPYLKDRPLIMKRYPAGIKGESFHQHDVNAAPEFVRTAALTVEDGGGHEVDYIVGDNLAMLLYMANLGAIERHPWHSRVRRLDRPDWFVFDLDPGPGVEFTTICALALAVREVLGRVGLESYPKTSGSRGIHVYVPVKPESDYDEVAEAAARVAAVVARENAEVATVERALKQRRRGQIYVDHMQNARGKSVVAPYSVRPRPGASVSAPLEWSEVARKRITPQSFTITNMLRRIDKKGDLFKPVLAGGQSLRGALNKIRELSGESPAGAKARRAKV